MPQTSLDILPHKDHARTIVLLEEIFGDRLATRRAVRAQHCHSVNWLPPQAPDAVVFPETTAEVAQIVAICRDSGTPVIPFGAGSSLEGHVNAPLGGVTISTRRMNRILEINTEDMEVLIQAGVTLSQLNADLRDTGLFFPIDPGADATLGGMAATRASGTNAVRYGTMRDSVLGLEVVLASSEVMHTGGRANLRRDTI